MHRDINRIVPQRDRGLFSRGALVVCLLVSIAVGGRSDTIPGVDLRGDPGWLPYRFAVKNYVAMHHVSGYGWMVGRRMADWNGDRAEDRVSAVPTGYVAQERENGRSNEIWQTNLPVAFTAPDAAHGVSGFWDVDDDGELEVVATAATADRMRWRVDVMSAVDGRIETTIPLAGGPDNRPDGRWDGWHAVVGAITVPTARGDRRALVVCSDAAFDLQPRGVRAIDLATGETLWDYPVGPRPRSDGLELVDLDGDGTDEIVFVGGGVNNLEGRRINGTSDDHGWLFVLNHDGTCRWRRRLGPAPTSDSLAIVDLDGDGRREIVLAGTMPEQGGRGLGIIDDAGDLMCWAQFEIPVCRVILGGSAGGARYAFIGRETEIIRFRLTRDAVTPDRVVRFDGLARPVMVDDVVAEPGHELIVSTMDHRSWLLTTDLEPLAMVVDDRIQLDHQSCSMLTDTDGSRYLTNLGINRFNTVSFGFERNPRPTPWSAVSIVGGGVGGMVLVWRYRRKRKRSPATLRELRLQLLGRLQLSGHGGIGSLSSLRRLHWHLQTLQEGFAAGDQVASLLDDLAVDVLKVSVPNLLAVCELADLANLDHEDIRDARAAVAQVRSLLEELVAADLVLAALPSVSRDLPVAIATAEKRFQALRRGAEASFCSDPQIVVRRYLEVCPDTEVTMEIDLDGVPACRIDEEELVFVIDNLLENALRAMQDSPTRRLTLSWKATMDHVEIMVSDSGCGIAPDDRERIMQPGGKKRRGGGLGLPHSQEILRKYGGRLAVLDSQPGSGTTMSLLLPRAAASEMEARA